MLMSNGQNVEHIGADAAGNVPTDRAEIRLCVRQNLERIARGER
jgi:hypothetical protein